MMTYRLSFSSWELLNLHGRDALVFAYAFH